MNDATASETHCECFVVGVTKLDKARLIVAPQYLECLSNHCAFDTSATHRTNYFAILIDSHCGTGIAWARAFDVDNASNGNLFACLLPALDVVQ